MRPPHLHGALSQANARREVRGPAPGWLLHQPRARTTHLSGPWWRHIPAGGEVYYEPPHPADNRWQRGAVVDALYFADSEATAWAEWYRYLAQAVLPPQEGSPRDLWHWEITLPVVADLSHKDRLAKPSRGGRAHVSCVWRLA